jgi:hypothetical protein
MTRLVVLLCLLSLSNAARADGGRLRLHESAGPFVITLFTTPDPLTQGTADFSVAVERSGDGGGNRGLVQDATVTLILTPPDASKPLVLAATHAEASSAFLQAANFTLPAAGVWKITVVVRQGADAGECSGQIEVLPYRVATDETAWQVAAIPLALLLFAVHQARKRGLRGTP